MLLRITLTLAIHQLILSALYKKQICQSILPSVDNDAAIRQNITFLVACVLSEQNSYFQHTCS